MPYQEHPTWITNARNVHHETRNGVSQETHIFRGFAARDVLRDTLLPAFPKEPIRILEVGPGLNIDFVNCPYEPYRLASLLEFHRHPYEMTIIDVNKEVVSDIVHRTKLVRMSEVGDPKDTAAWNEYLEETGYAQQIIHDPEPDLIFQEWIDDTYKRVLLDSGFLTAPIPEGFAEKLASGNLPVIHGDIATVEPDAIPHAPFHLINATNVFIYLRNIGQKLALYNLSQMLDPKGFIVLNDYDLLLPCMESLFQKKFHGWLTEEDLHTVFGLEIYGKPKKEDLKTTYMLKKISTSLI